MSATTPPRPIIVHGLAHASAAIAAAAAAGCPAVLMSAPGAAGYAGVAWFHALAVEAGRTAPAVAVTAILDCADQPGHVLGAWRARLSAVRFTGPAEVAAKLDAIAAGCGARLHAPALGTDVGPTLDLDHAAEPVAACGAWLVGEA